jgi:hypothetical protein
MRRRRHGRHVDSVKHNDDVKHHDAIRHHDTHGRTDIVSSSDPDKHAADDTIAHGCSDGDAEIVRDRSTYMRANCHDATRFPVCEYVPRRVRRVGAHWNVLHVSDGRVRLLPSNPDCDAEQDLY